jgi:hypothetical protein
MVLIAGQQLAFALSRDPRQQLWRCAAALVRGGLLAARPGVSVLSPKCQVLREHTGARALATATLLQLIVLLFVLCLRTSLQHVVSAWLVKEHHSVYKR